MYVTIKIVGSFDVEYITPVIRKEGELMKAVIYGLINSANVYRVHDYESDIPQQSPSEIAWNKVGENLRLNIKRAKTEPAFLKAGQPQSVYKVG